MGRPRSLRGASTVGRAVGSGAIVRDFSDVVGRVNVALDVRPAYDFLFSLVREGDPSEALRPEDLRWLRTARTSLLAELDADTVAMVRSPGFLQLAALLPELPGVRYGADLADVLEEDGIEAVGSRSVGFTDGDLPKLLPLLRGWARRFDAVESRVRGMLERDFAGRSREVSSLEPMALVERLTGGLRWLPEPGVEKVILAPSYFVRPGTYAFSGPTWRLFAYPVDDEAIDAPDDTAPPGDTVRLYRALGDETRLRIIKLLAGRDWYLTELSRELGLSKPTIKHHLDQLRAVGLVTTSERGAVIYCSLRTERIEEVGADLRRFIGC